MRRTGRHPVWMRFSIEFHHAGGNCWVLQECGMPRYLLRCDSEWFNSHWIVGEDAIRAHAYGRFRRYVDALDNRERIVLAYTATPLWRLFDGVRLVEHRDDRATEIVRYVRR